jgi:hypothetical protein
MVLPGVWSGGFPAPKVWIPAPAVRVRHAAAASG